MKGTNTLLLSLIAIILLAGLGVGGYLYYAGRYRRDEQNRVVAITKTSISDDDTVYESFS